MKNGEELLEWITLNPELAEKYFPELVSGLEKRMGDIDPFFSATIIQKLPKFLYKWKNEAEQYSGLTKSKIIQSHIDLINMALLYTPDNEIELAVRESVRGELCELIDILKQDLIPQQIQTKKEKLKAELGKYGFFELHAVKPLSELNREKLLELVCSNDLPYCIAMFDFLQFFKHLEKEHFKIKGKLYKEISKWFNSDKVGRAVKGNINSLSNNTNENKSRYTAHLHKEKIKKDYQKLN